MLSAPKARQGWEAARSCVSRKTKPAKIDSLKEKIFCARPLKEKEIFAGFVRRQAASRWGGFLPVRAEILAQKRFALRSVIAGLLNQIFDNIYKLVIGKQYSATDLGFYTQAKRIQELPVMNSLSILQRVTFPVYATIQDETERLKNAYRKTIKGIIYFNFPLMIGLAVLSPLLIKILLTDKWLPAVPYLQLLCLVGLVYPLSSVNLNILKVKGRTDIFFYLEVAKKVVIAIAIIITLKMGVLTMVIGQVIASYVCFFLNIYYSGRVINYSVKEQLLDILPYLCISIIMGLCMIISLRFISLNNIIELILGALIGIVSYYLLSRISKLEAYLDAVAVLSDFSLNKAKALFG